MQALSQHILVLALQFLFFTWIPKTLENGGNLGEELLRDGEGEADGNLRQDRAYSLSPENNDPTSFTKSQGEVLFGL